MEWEGGTGGLKKMSRRFSVVKNTSRSGARAYVRAAQREMEKRVGMESPVHGLRKVSHDIRHVITFRALTSQSNSSGL